MLLIFCVQMLAKLSSKVSGELNWLTVGMNFSLNSSLLCFGKMGRNVLTGVVP